MLDLKDGKSFHQIKSSLYIYYSNSTIFQYVTLKYLTLQQSNCLSIQYLIENRSYRHREKNVSLLFNLCEMKTSIDHVKNECNKKFKSHRFFLFRRN